MNQNVTFPDLNSLHRMSKVMIFPLTRSRSDDISTQSKFSDLFPLRIPEWSLEELLSISFQDHSCAINGIQFRPTKHGEGNRSIGLS